MNKETEMLVLDGRFEQIGTTAPAPSGREKMTTKAAKEFYSEGYRDALESKAGRDPATKPKESHIRNCFIANTGEILFSGGGNVRVTLDGYAIIPMDQYKEMTEPSGRDPETRQTFTIPDGFEAVRDPEGRATGEVRRIEGRDPATIEACAKIAEAQPWFVKMGEDHVRQMKGADIANMIRALAAPPSLSNGNRTEGE